MLLIALKQFAIVVVVDFIARIAHAIDSVETIFSKSHGYTIVRVLRMLLIALKQLHDSAYVTKGARIAHAIDSVETKAQEVQYH